MESNPDPIRTWLGSGSINIFGKPFAGKDTQGRRLADLLGGVSIGGGAILRASADRIPTQVNDLIRAGHLIPTNEFIKIVLPFLGQPDLHGKPLVLSSVGRWHGEEPGVIAATAQSGHPLKAVFYLALDDDQVIARWHALKDKNDRGDRHDDTLEVLQTRLTEYQQKTLPVLETYRQAGILIEINGNQPPQAVFEDILSALTARASHTS